MENNTFCPCPRSHCQLSYPFSINQSKGYIISKSHDLLYIMSLTTDEQNGMASMYIFSLLSEIFNMK